MSSVSSRRTSLRLPQSSSRAATERTLMPLKARPVMPLSGRAVMVQ
jgi:hypothetical protein